MEIKNLFFDRKAVTDAVDAAALKMLRHAGGYVRKTARNFMKRSAKPSPPGKPPAVHSGLLKQFLFFAFEPGRRSLVVGPALISRRHDVVPVGLTVPATLEFGGTVAVHEVRRHGKWVRADLARRLALRRGEDPGRMPARVRNVHVAARPFMAPAIEATAPKFPSLFVLQHGGMSVFGAEE